MHQPVIAIVGLRFGSSFAELYHLHPGVAGVVLCDADPAAAAELSRRLGGVRILPDFAAVLADPTIAAVHLVTPIPLHAEQSVAALEAGKHVACAVPAATDLAGCRRLLAAERASGKRYLMAETQAFSSDFLLVRDLHRRGALGRLQYLTGAHHQNMEGWPDYWRGLPPMWYATHALMPLLLLADSPITQVSCFGSGSIRRELAERHGSPFAVETANFRFANGLVAQVERSLFETAVPASEEFAVFGSAASFTGNRLVRLGDRLAADGRGFGTTVQPVHPPLRLDLLTPGFAARLLGVHADRPEWPVHAGHGGSHPHLVDEFVRCITEDRASVLDAAASAMCCAAAAMAHQSALAGGALLDVPGL